MELRKLIDLLIRNEEVAIRNHETSTKVVIPIKRVGTVGGSPSVEVESVGLGFDWDKGKLFITTKENLRIVDEDELSKIREEHRKLGWTDYEIRNLKRENTKLREENALLRNQNNV